jgi:exonuclease III
MIHKSLQSAIDNYTFWNERIIEARLILTRGYITVLSIYASVEGKEESKSFYKLLQKVVDKVNKSDMLVLMGDFNARIGRNKVKGNIGAFGETVCNNNEIKLRDFVLYSNMKIMVPFFLGMCEQSFFKWSRV